MKQDEQVVPSSSRLRSPGAHLRWHRLRLGLTQEALAEAIDVSTRSIRRWEQDLALPQEISRERLAQLFNIDHYHLLASSPIEQPPRPSIPLSAGAADLLPATSKPGMLLLESKLRPPRLPSTLVVRDRLLKRLDAVREHQLTVLSASAGWGKTTLLSAWAAQSSDHIAWVSLNDLDNDPTRFWVLVMAALRTCLPSVGETALALLQSSQPPALTTVLTSFIQQIEATSPDSDSILILDDYQIVEDPTIHETMLFLLSHLPASLRLVLSSRVDPALPLSRWRVRGQMLELHDAEMSFTKEEACRFLKGAMGYPLAQEEVYLLQERTEGWIAGLQLAALAMHERQDLSAFVKKFSGSHRLLLDYVQEEILQHQPLPLQRFLLQTAVLTQMNAALCQAVSGEQASQQRLEALERSHLFVVALDEERRWYRFHSLFREALLARLYTSQPEQVPQLHQRAAHWYDQQGDVQESMSHALAAADYNFAACLVERAAEQLWLNGRGKTVHNWIKQFPDAILRRHARLALTASLHLLHQTQYTPPAQLSEVLTQVEQVIIRLEHIFKSQEGDSETVEALQQAEERLLRQRIRLLRGVSAMREAYLQGNGAQLHLIAQSMQQADVLEDDVAWKMLPIATLISSFAFQGNVTAVLPRLLEIKQRAHQARDRSAIIRATYWATMLYLRSGQLRLAYQECLQVLEVLKQREEQISTVGYLHFDLAVLHWMWNQLDEAFAYLRIAMQQVRLWQNMDLLMFAYYSAIQVLLAAERKTEAAQMLEEAERLAQRRSFALHRSRIAAARVQIWLAQGNLAAARTWAASYHFTPNALEYIHKHEDLMLARVYLAQQQYTEAWRVLVPLLSQAQRNQRGWDVAHILALQVVALQGSGERVQARQVAARLLSLTEPEGYVRIYLEAGELMQQVLQSFLDAPHDPGQTPPTASTVAVSYVAQLVVAFTQKVSKPSQAQQRLPSPMDWSTTEKDRGNNEDKQR